MKLRYGFSTRWDFWRVATTEEILRVEVFLGVLLVIFLVALAFGLRWWLQRRGRLRPALPRERALRSLSFTLAGACVLCILYGFLIEPNWLHVTHLRLVDRRLPAAAGTIRIVHISDLHCEGWTGPEARVPDLVAAEKPDLIVFTGDAQNTVEGIHTAIRCLSRLRQIAPTVAVRGNWDLPDDPQFPTFAEAGVPELDGKVADFTLHGAHVKVGGIRAFHEIVLGDVLKGLQGADLNVLLTHYPNYVDSAAGAGIDLYCAGHTHGGQICLPFYGAMVVFARYGKEYESGLYTVGQMNLYVSRGIGTHTVHARFLAPPEITVMDIVSKE